MSVFGVVLVCVFLHLDWTRRDTAYLSEFSLNVGKYGPEKLRIWTIFTQFETSLLNDLHRKTGKKNLIWLRFIDYIFCVWTDGEDSLKKFSAFFKKHSETKNMKSVIKFEISQSTKTNSFLHVCITLNSQTLSTTVFSKPTDAHIYLNPKSCHPEHMIKNI